VKTELNLHHGATTTLTILQSRSAHARLVIIYNLNTYKSIVMPSPGFPSSIS